IEARLREAKRVGDIHRRLSVANLEFCKRRTRALGLQMHSVTDYPKAMQDAAKLAGARYAPSIAYVLDGSPAPRAGLLPGDRLMAIGDQRYPSTNAGLRQMSEAIVAWTAPGPIPFTIKRGETELPVAIAPEEICDYPIYLSEEDTINAAATG